MARRQRRTNRPFHLLHKFGPEIRFVARRHDEEQEDGLVGVVRPAARHAQTVGDGAVEQGSFDHVVDLARPEADARRVEHAVGAPQDLQAVGARVQRREVVLGPDVQVIYYRFLAPVAGGEGEAFEIRLAVLPVTCVAPEAARHAGKRGAADQFASDLLLFLVSHLSLGLRCRRDQRLPRLRVEDVARVAQRPHLHFVREHRPRRVRGDPRTRDVGAARDGGEVDLPAGTATRRRNALRRVEPQELGARERCAGGGDES